MSIWKKILAFLLAAIVLLACRQYESHAALGGGTNVHNHSSAAAGGTTINTTGSINAGSVAVTGNLSSTKACASGFVRLGPNLCHEIITYVTFTAALTRDVCTTITAPAVDAKALLISVNPAAKAGNAILYRSTQINAWNDSGCATTPVATIISGAYEHVAVAAGTQLSITFDTDWFVPLSSAGANTYLTLSDDAGNQGTSSYRIRGYFD